MIKSLSRLAFEQLSLSIALSPFIVYLSNHWRRCLLLLSFYQLYEVFSIDQDLTLMLNLLASLSLEPVPSFS